MGRSWMFGVRELSRGGPIESMTAVAPAPDGQLRRAAAEWHCEGARHRDGTAARRPLRDRAGGIGGQFATVVAALPAPTLKPTADHRRHTESNEGPKGLPFDRRGRLKGAPPTRTEAPRASLPRSSPPTADLIPPRRGRSPNIHERRLRASAPEAPRPRPQPSLDRLPTFPKVPDRPGGRAQITRLRRTALEPSTRSPLFISVGLIAIWRLSRQEVRRRHHRPARRSRYRT